MIKRQQSKAVRNLAAKELRDQCFLSRVHLYQQALEKARTGLCPSRYCSADPGEKLLANPIRPYSSSVLLRPKHGKQSSAQIAWAIAEVKRQFEDVVDCKSADEWAHWEHFIPHVLNMNLNLTPQQPSLLDEC